MPQQFIIILSVDEPTEEENFTQWLAEHRSSIIGMSDNVGCGCCIDSYYIVAESNTPVPPSGASGTFEARKVLYGAQRDEVLDMLLDF